MSKLLIGWAEESIVPDKKVSLQGQFFERISQYVESEITVTAMAVEADGDQMILVSADLTSIPGYLLVLAREKFAAYDLGVDPRKLMVGATHTHTSHTLANSRAADTDTFASARSILEEFFPEGKRYETLVTPDESVMNPKDATEFVTDKIALAAKRAWEGRQEALYTNEFGRAAVGMCRRVSYDDGSGQMWGDVNTANFVSLEGGNDSGIELLYMFDENKKVTGIVVNLACPAQCVQHRLFVSPDFWGEVKVRCRKYFGEDLFILAQCSAAGDQCPVDLVRWVQPYTDINDPNCLRVNPPKRKADPSMFDLEGMYKAGKRIANEIIEIWEEGLDEPQTEPKFEHRVKNMQLPIRRATLTDLNKAKQGIKDYLRDKNGADVDYNDVANLQVHLGVLNRFKAQEVLDVLDTEVHVIRMGTVAFASNPFELFLDFGNQIKARSDAEQTFLIQLANGAEGYLPTAKAEEHGHYSAFISSGQVGHIGGEQLVRETLQNIRQMFAE